MPISMRRYSGGESVSFPLWRPFLTLPGSTPGPHCSLPRDSHSWREAEPHGETHKCPVKVPQACTQACYLCLELSQSWCPPAMLLKLCHHSLGIQGHLQKPGGDIPWVTAGPPSQLLGVGLAGGLCCPPLSSLSLKLPAEKNDDSS